MCEEQKMSKNISPELLTKFGNHVNDNIKTKAVRQSDSVVLCFDLENAIPCPRAGVSNFFYKRKHNVYNLTAHWSMNKKGYNAV